MILTDTPSLSYIHPLIEHLLCDGTEYHSEQAAALFLRDFMVDQGAVEPREQIRPGSVRKSS